MRGAAGRLKTSSTKAETATEALAALWCRWRRCRIALGQPAWATSDRPAVLRRAPKAKQRGSSLEISLEIEAPSSAREAPPSPRFLQGSLDSRGLLESPLETCHDDAGEPQRAKSVERSSRSRTRRCCCVGSRAAGDGANGGILGSKSASDAASEAASEAPSTVRTPSRGRPSAFSSLFTSAF